MMVLIWVFALLVPCLGNPYKHVLVETVKAVAGAQFSPEAVKLILQTFDTVIKHKNTCTKYDFVVNLDSVTSLSEEAHGWPIYVYSNEARKILLSKNNALAKDATIASLLGYYSKGKSFILNGIYHAGLAIDRKAFFASPDLRCVEVGAGVTTQGISGVFSGYNPGENQPMSDARLLLLDTAGRNAPADLEAPNQTVDELLAGVSAIRSKERLVDDVIVGISDTIIYVLDEVLNEDQRTLMHIIDHIAKSRSGQRLIVIHNWKRLSCHETEDVNKMIAGQLTSAFNATEILQQPGELGAGFGARQWKSSWRFGQDQIVVQHVVLYNDELCSSSNKVVFNWLFNVAVGFSRTKVVRGKILDNIAKEAFSSIFKYVKIGECEASPGSEFVKTHGGEASAHISLDIGARKCLTLLDWELREMPRAFSVGSFTPHSFSFSQDKMHIIRVDLTGIKLSQRVALNETPPLHESWFKIRPVKSHTKNDIVIEGFRKRPDMLTADSTSDFGTFELTFEISPYFDGDRTLNLEDGCLIITVGVKSQQDF